MAIGMNLLVTYWEKKFEFALPNYSFSNSRKKIFWEINFSDKKNQINFFCQPMNYILKNFFYGYWNLKRYLSKISLWKIWFYFSWLMKSTDTLTEFMKNSSELRSQYKNCFVLPDNLCFVHKGTWVLEVDSVFWGISIWAWP